MALKKEVFTCDVPGCTARLERWPGARDDPPDWWTLEVPHQEEGLSLWDGGRLISRLRKPARLCPACASECAKLFAHVPFPRAGEPTEKTP